MGRFFHAESAESAEKVGKMLSGAKSRWNRERADGRDSWIGKIE